MAYRGFVIGGPLDGKVHEAPGATFSEAGFGYTFLVYGVWVPSTESFRTILLKLIKEAYFVELDKLGPLGHIEPIAKGPIEKDIQE